MYMSAFYLLFFTKLSLSFNFLCPLSFSFSLFLCLSHISVSSCLCFKIPCVLCYLFPNWLFLCLCPSPHSGKEEEYPKKPLGQLPPEPMTNHVANGQTPGGQVMDGPASRGPSPANQSVSLPAEVGPAPSPSPDRANNSRPPSRTRRDSLEKLVRLAKVASGDRSGARNRSSGGSSDMESRKHQPSGPSERGHSPAPTPPNATSTPDWGPQKTPGVPQGQHQLQPPHHHAAANHNSNAGSSARPHERPFTPRWVKPSETKLEAAKAAALRETHASRAASPMPTIPVTPVTPTTPNDPGGQGSGGRRPRSHGFTPGSNRASNASQYDNVPGPDGLPIMEVVELEQPPSRPPIATPSFQQSSPTRPPSGGFSSGSAPRRHPNQNMAALPPLQAPNPHSGGGAPAAHQSPHHFYPPPASRQHSPVRAAAVPMYTPPFGLDARASEDRPGYGLSYGERGGYATTQRQPHSASLSPEKALMNNTYATYRRQPSHLQHHPRPAPLSVAPLDLSAQLDSSTGGSSSRAGSGHHGGQYPPQRQRMPFQPIDYQPVDYRHEPRRRGLDDGASYATELRGGWGVREGELPPRSPGGMPRSPSFQKAQMSPVQEFIFPPLMGSDAVLGSVYRGGYHHHPHQQQPQPQQQEHLPPGAGRQPQLPHLFGGVHYSQAQEAFAMQESMLL